MDWMTVLWAFFTLLVAVLMFGMFTFPLWFPDVERFIYKLLEYRCRLKGK